ncbi:hypothetical protein SETIT_1G120300v2 [Setaria italica]|uniref:Uncharacterized protein n=1 Tax=Setaria italica TaxID=4555 RepID=A0A368PKG6_SETIT|nr:hypothetical protein SETIT_1G120300v2 [Setaria italica]
MARRARKPTPRVPDDLFCPACPSPLLSAFPDRPRRPELSPRLRLIDPPLRRLHSRKTPRNLGPRGCFGGKSAAVAVRAAICPVSSIGYLLSDSAHARTVCREPDRRTRPQVGRPCCFR